MLENPDVLPKMVAESGAHEHRSYREGVTPEQLREKTVEAAAEAWSPVADRIWNDFDESAIRPSVTRTDRSQGMAATDMKKFKAQGHYGYTEEPTATK